MHDLSDAFELTDRVIVLKKTKIFDGSSRDLVECSDILAEANLELPSLLKMMSPLGGEDWKGAYPSVDDG